MGWLGTFQYTLFREGRLVTQETCHNSLTKRGAVMLVFRSLHGPFNGGIPNAEGGGFTMVGDTHWIGLINAAGFGGLDRADHFLYPGPLAPTAAWVEFTSYISPFAGRLRFDFPDQIGLGLNSISSDTVLFEITASAILQGVFLTNRQPKVIKEDVWASAEFPSPLTVKIGDILCVDYTATLTIT